RVTLILLLENFCFDDSASTEIYTLSLHDALPISALVLPAAADAWGFVGAMSLPALLSLLALPFVLIMPETPSAPARSSGKEKEAEPEPARTGSPYRHWTIWRVHGVSMLLGVPQVALMTYAVIYLVQEQGW